MDKKEAVELRNSVYETMEAALGEVEELIIAAIDPPTKPEAPESEYTIERCTTGCEVIGPHGFRAYFSGSDEALLSAVRAVNALNAGPAMVELCRKRLNAERTTDEDYLAALALMVYGPDGKRREIGVDDG